MNVSVLDLHFQNTRELIAAYLFETDEGLALVETGPGSTLDALREGIRNLGAHEADVRHVFVTHIHLDHAGAAGWWAQQGAQLYCHANAARHLLDPSRLIESAKMIYADKMDSLWGTMLPAPPDRVTVLMDGERVRLGNLEVVAYDTPGHARHHLAFACENTLFTGDMAGMRLPGSAYLSVTSAPPQFELLPYLQSVERMAALRPEKLFLTHFGQVEDSVDHFSHYAQRLQDVYQAIETLILSGLSAEEIRTAYEKREHALAEASGVSEADWQRLQRSNATSMCADGLRFAVEKQKKKTGEPLPS